LKHVRTLFLAFLTLLCGSVAAQTREEGLFTSQTDPFKIAKLYPNPAIEYINVSFEEPIAKEAKITVHNIIGNALDLEIENIDEHELRIKIKDLPTGYYIVAIRDERTNSRSTLKFLKR
jgi:hypothetical protein